MRRRLRDTTVTLVGVLTVRRGGKTYRYLRRKGHPLVRLPDLPLEHPDFLAAYAKARGVPKLVAAGPALPGSVAALCQAALASDAYKAKSKGYRNLLRRHLDAIGQRGRTAIARGLQQPHVARDVKAAASPEDRLKAWRFLFAFALAAELMDADPSQGLKAAPRATKGGHEAWTADDVDAYRARWPLGTKRRAAMELLFWTGARISDAVRLGVGMVGRDGVLAYRQQKTGDLAFVPWTCPLPAYAEAMDADREMTHAALASLAGHMTFIPAHGKMRSDKALGTMIRLAAREAGVEKSAHGLRKARATALAEGRATTHQIAAWTGHQSLSEVDHYTKSANRRLAVIGEERTANRANGAAQVQTTSAKSLK